MTRAFAQRNNLFDRGPGRVRKFSTLSKFFGRTRATKAFILHRKGSRTEGMHWSLPTNATGCDFCVC